MKKKVFLILLIFCTVFLPAHSQDRFSVDMSAGVVSRHVWRGLLIGETENSHAVPHFQPGAVFNYSFGEIGNLKLGFVGTYGISNEYSESDFFLSYTLPTEAGHFTAQIFDFHYPFKGIDFGNFDSDGTGAHTLEVSLKYLGTINFPIGIFISNNFHNVTPGDKTFYSEVSYPFVVNEVYLNLFIGGSLGESRWHVVKTDGFTITNLGFTGTRFINLSEETEIRVSVSWIYNPHLENSYVTFGISI